MNPISCDLHDYIEVACIYGYDIRLTLVDHSIIEGKAQTTSTHTNKIEAIQIWQDSGTLEVPLHEIAHMEVLTPNAKFRDVKFTS